MIGLLQRVSSARVMVADEETAAIGPGLWCWSVLPPVMIAPAPTACSSVCSVTVYLRMLPEK